jgi:hypothetical protein
MYCPKCNQQQISESVRFCSRCGFALDAVAQLIANDGVLAPFQTELQGLQTSPRRKGIRDGAKLTLAGLVLTPVGYALCFIFDSPIPVILPLTVFLAGLAWMLYFRVFGETAALAPKPPPSSLFDTSSLDFALPSARSIPASLHTSDTAEMMPPPSVAEHTTKLLDTD